MPVITMKHTPSIMTLLLFTLGICWAKEPSQMSLMELHSAYDANPRDINVALSLGVRYHDQLRKIGAGEGYQARSNRQEMDDLHKKSMKYLKRAQFMTRFGPVPEAYIGSLTIIRGRDCCLSGRGLLVRWRGPLNFGIGARMIDNALKTEPDNVTIRLVRIADAENIPSSLSDGSDETVAQTWELRTDRIKLARQDLDFLLEKCKTDQPLADRLQVARLHLRSAKLASLLSKFDEARQHLERALLISKAPDILEEANEIKKDMPESADDSLNKSLKEFNID